VLTGMGVGNSDMVQDASVIPGVYWLRDHVKTHVKSMSSKFVTHTANKLHHATAARAHDARPHCRLKSPF